LIWRCRKSAPVCVDNSAADGKTHTHPILFCREEWFENPFQVLGVDPRPRVPNFDHNVPMIYPAGSDEQVFPPSGSLLHGIDPVQNQIQDYLLNLNAI